MTDSTPPVVQPFDEVKQRRLDLLLEKNSDGSIAESELQELKSLVAEAEKLMIRNAQLLASSAAAHCSDAPEDAVPVTVWVHPDSSSR